MADLVLGVAKLLVEGALTKAQSVIDEDTKLRESAQRDLVFIAGEFQMMQSFLNTTSKEHIKNNTVSTWVTQVRDLAYDVEDGIEFVIHLDTESSTCWRRFFTLPWMARPLPLDEAVSNIQLLKARVEDVSQRSARYNLIMDSSPKPQPPAASSAAAVAVLGMLAEAKDKQRHLEVLTEFLTKKDDSSLQVISVWARGRELETASIIRKVYDDPIICRKFQCRAWVKLMHPFNPREFIQSLLSQFYSLKEKHGAIRGNDVLNRIKAATAAEYHLVQEFARLLNNQTYLIVVDGLSTMVEWDSIRTYLPDRRNGSRIIVSTQHFEIASFCTGNPYLQRVIDDHSHCVFFETASEGSNRGTGEASDRATISGKKARMDHLPLFGRDSQIEELHRYLMKARIRPLSVMSVWGTNGVGKSASVRNLYYRRLCDDTQLFDKYGWVDVSHPFNVRDFSQTLFQEFSSDSLEATADAMEECREILKNLRCLIVIDGLHSKEEWDMIQAAMVPGPNSIIIVITTEVSIALHCAGTEEFVLNIKCLEDDAAFHLLKKEVHKKNQISTIKDVSDNSELRKLISMCGGLPKVIVAAAGLLATDAVKWENIASSMNAQFMHYLETKQEFASLRDLFGWMHSYFRALPDDLRQSIAYLSLFPGHCTIRRRRLVMRWVAEGYSKDNDSYTAAENGEKLFSKLVELSMIQPPRLTNTGLVSYQVSEFFREYIISRPVEENITVALEIFALKGHCYPTSQRRGRHLVIEESWNRDRIVFDNIDFSRLRSLTVLGKWESFFISRSMKVLRVLDLEDASGVTNKDVEKILELFPRLKFLSLRGCRQVTHLPSSSGELRQLQILDVRGTSIVSIPASISKLKKLQYIRAGTTEPPTPCTVVVSWLAKLFGLRQLPGVKVPTGIRKMTLLHTLGVVNVGAAGGKTILKELKNLTHLRKLGLSGISKRNSKDFCSAISCHAHLESLSLWLSNSKGDQGCYLDDISSHPENLRSLKLYGLGQELPAWIKDLHKLTKLELDMTVSSATYGDIISVLGDMKELHTLHVCVKKSLQDGGDIKLHFCVELYGVETPCYTKVKVLQIACRSRSLLGVTFGREAMQNLELMVVGCCSESKLQFKDLKRLSPHKLKEVRVLVSSDNTLNGFETLKKDLEALQNDLKAEAFKDMDSKLELKDVRHGRSRNNMLKLKALETIDKNMETLQKNLDSQLKLKEVRLLGSRDDTLRDLEILKKDLGMKDVETEPLKMKLDKLKVKLEKFETLEKKLETLKMKNIEELKTDFEEQLMEHPRNPAVSLEYY